MFGDILIDKFNCYIPVNPQDKDKTEKLKFHVEEVLSKHYAENAFKVSISKNAYRLSFWFTPTRYFKNITDIEQYTDTNLSMPEEKELLSFFNELCENEFLRSNINKCKITKLDLTKNFLMKEHVCDYINVLSNRSYMGRYKAILHTSKDCETLSVTTLASNSEKSDKVGDREIIFYDKVKELKNHKINKVYLKEPLTEAEEKLIPIYHYDKNLQILDLRPLNIQRIEIQFGSSNKLEALSNFLGFKNNQKGLYLKDFMSLLSKNELYKRLNDFYTTTLLEILLLNESNSNTKLNVYQKIITEYWPQVTTLPLYNVFKNTGLADKHRKNLMKTQNSVNNSLIEELKELINK